MKKCRRKKGVRGHCLMGEKKRKKCRGNRGNRVEKYKCKWKGGGGVELNNGNRIENLIINKSSWICFTCNETKIKILQNGFVE